MKYKLSIGEFAKLKNVTTESLRHYDRVDLLKPAEINPETGYRYYSVFQSEKLASIIELKALGFSIDEMKVFFENRQIKQTYDFLEDRHNKLLDEIQEMNRLEKSLSKKLDRLKYMMELEASDSYTIRIEPERQVAFMEPMIENTASLEWLASELENQLIMINPVIGSDAYGVLMSKKSFFNGKLLEQTNLIYFIDDILAVDSKLLYKIPEQKVACFMVRNSDDGFENAITTIIQSLKDNHLTIVGDIVVRFRINSTSTDVISEQLYEFQIPIK